MDSADPRACARPSSSPARRSKGAQKKRGLAVAVEEEEEVQTAENNQVCDRLPLPPEYGQEPGREHRPCRSAPQPAVIWSGQKHS